jgi:hypothetical protein
MSASKKLVLACLAGALILSGCGSDSSSQEADRAAITEAVDGINTAVRDGDGGAYCDLLEPDTFLGASSPDATFNSKQQCATETDRILEQAGRQPALNIENISFEGDDAALASFTGRNGEARFVKVNGEWYLSLGAVAGDSSDSSGATGTTGEGGG